MTNRTPLAVTVPGSSPFRQGQKVPPERISESASTITGWGMKVKEHSVWQSNGVQQVINPQTTIVVSDEIQHGPSKPDPVDCNLYANESFTVATKEVWDAQGTPGIYKRLNSDSRCGDYPLSFEIK